MYASTVSASRQSLPTPTKTGYVFAGWFTAPASGSGVADGTGLRGVFGDGPISRTLYARYAGCPDVAGAFNGDFNRGSSGSVAPPTCH